MIEILTKRQLLKFDKCYAVYQKKESVGAAKKAWNKLGPDDELANKIFRAILAQNINRKKNPVEKQYLPCFGPWLNAQKWLDPIDSNKPEPTGSPLGNCQCGKKIDYAYSKRCMTCEGLYIRAHYRQRVADTLTRMGIYVPGDTQQELNAKCRQYLTKNKDKIINSKKVT